MDVVVVESPTKAKTINKYLGDKYRVLASYGHVRDLPEQDDSVLPDEDFKIIYEALQDKKKRVDEIVQAVKGGAKRLILATDPDREGEAISWHLLELLNQRKALKGVDVERVVFHEVTKPAVLEAMRHGRSLDEHLIDAYQARRALDYLVGFRLSPVLWRKLPKSGSSAGRVQSVALRLICEREAEIHAFRAQEYWTVEALLETPQGRSFKAKLTQLDGKRLDKFALRDEAAARRAVREIEARALAVDSDREEAGQPQSGAAVQHLDPAAGGLAQAGLLGRSDDEDRPAPVRGRGHRRRDGGPDHLHAHRQRPALRRGAGRLPPVDRPAVRRRLPPGQAAAVQDQDQERPGSARGDPADRSVPRARRAARPARRRPAAALRPDLEAHRRQPDGGGPARPRHRRHRLGRRRRRAARDRPDGGLRRLPQALPGGPRRPHGRGGRGRRHAAAARGRTIRSSSAR